METIKNDLPAALTDPKSQIFIEAKKLIEEKFGQSPIIKGAGPTNESYLLINKGIPTITGFGPKGDGFHSANEYAETSSIYQSIKFLTSLAQNI